LSWRQRWKTRIDAGCVPIWAPPLVYLLNRLYRGGNHFRGLPGIGRFFIPMRRLTGITAGAWNGDFLHVLNVMLKPHSRHSAMLGLDPKVTTKIGRSYRERRAADVAQKLYLTCHQRAQPDAGLH